MHRPITLIAAALLLLASSSLQAKTTLDVQIGWGNTIRMGRWTPVVITLADPDGPDVIVDAMSSHDRMYGVKITQYLGTLSVSPKQFQLLVPLESFSPYNSDPVWVVVRNAKTGKLLAKTDPEDPNTPRARAQFESVENGFHMIGISGGKTRLSELKSAVPNSHLSIDHLEMSLLPITAAGYDMLDVLLLNAPDLNELSVEQQTAIANWVRAGGNLLMWPGEEPAPTSGPLIELLPCDIGKVGITELPAELLVGHKLPRRFGRLSSRLLTPARGGETVTLFGNADIVGYQRNVGLGKVIVSPINLAQFQFDSPKELWAMWSNALGTMIALPPDALAAQTNYGGGYGYNYNGVDETAKQQVADVLGTVAGSGRFGFSYVAIVLIGMMVIVGPVDWFVLRMLKKQAWTWITTSGWIALVTLGAIYIGHIVKSGDLHLRTFTLIDQVDGAAVAREEIVGIYSPRTADYELAVQPMGWWQPFAPGMGNGYGYNPNQFSNQIDFHQTYHDNAPSQMQINVWSLRFLDGQTIEPGPALLEAHLTIEDRQGKQWVVGTIKNRGDHPIHGAQAIQRDGQALLRMAGTTTEVSIAPGASAQVEGMIPLPPAAASANGSTLTLAPALGQVNSYTGAGDDEDGQAAARPDDLWNAATTLGGERMTRIRARLADGKYLCLLAGVENPTPAATIDVGPAKEQHWQMIRALVPIE